jgi:hypothetical protein
MWRIIFLISFLFSFTAFGQVLVDESNISPRNGLSIGGSLGLSQVEYKYHDDYTFEIDRKTLGLGLVSSLGSSANLLFQIGYTFDAEYEDTDWEGKGWMLGGGVNFLIHRGRKVDFVGYGLLNYIQEEYDWHDKLNADFSMMDLHLGGLVVFKASPKVSLYLGPEFIPYSEGEIKFSDKYHKQKIEREDMLNFKLGMSIATDSVVIRPEVTFMNEQTLMLTVNF